MDGRNKAQFRQDIQDGIQTERQIIWRWLNLTEATTGKRPACVFNGCGSAEIFLTDEEVSAEADYVVEGIGKLEIKFSRPPFRHFHLKVSQVESYVKQNATILMVHGWATDDPTFTLMAPDILKRGLTLWPRIPFKGFGGKVALRIRKEEFIWRKLP